MRLDSAQDADAFVALFHLFDADSGGADAAKADHLCIGGQIGRADHADALALPQQRLGDQHLQIGAAAAAGAKDTHTDCDAVDIGFVQSPEGHAARSPTTFTEIRMAFPGK